MLRGVENGKSVELSREITCVKGVLKAFDWAKELCGVTLVK